MCERDKTRQPRNLARMLSSSRRLRLPTPAGPVTQSVAPRFGPAERVIPHDYFVRLGNIRCGGYTVTVTHDIFDKIIYVVQCEYRFHE